MTSEEHSYSLCNPQLKIHLYILSQYFWWIFILTVTLIPFLITRHKVKDFEALDPIESDINSIPLLIAHITDIHISPSLPDAISNFQAIINSINLFKPNLVINTGDLAHNIKRSHSLLYSDPQKEDWDLYFNLSQPLRKYNYLETLGNHDNWGLHQYNENKYAQFYNYTEHNFYSRTFVLSEKHGSFHKKYSFIRFNPFKFPTGKDFYLYFGIASPTLLDYLEKDIESAVSRNDTLILLNHYPYTFFPATYTSKKDHSFKEILALNNVSYLFSGHLHPEPSIINHADNIIEFIGIDSKKHCGYSMITIDNGRLSYHTVYSKYFEKPHFFIASPIPTRQLSTRTPSNAQNTPLKVIAYTPYNDPPILYAKIQKDNIRHDLNCSNIDSNRFYCSLPLSFSDGPHNITVTMAHKSSDASSESIDQIEELKFTTGSHIKGFYESGYFYRDIRIIVVPLVIIGVLLCFITFPITCQCENIINGRYETLLTFPLDDPSIPLDFNVSSETEDKYLERILSVFGFLPLRWRLKRLPQFIQWYLFIISLWPSCLPLYFGTIHDTLGIYWVYGVITPMGSTIDPYGWVAAGLYYLFNLIPTVLFLSSLTTPIMYSGYIPISELVLHVLSIFATTYFSLWAVYRSGKILGSLSSPVFSIIPLINAILIYPRFFIHMKRREKNANHSTDQLISH